MRTLEILDDYAALPDDLRRRALVTLDMVPLVAGISRPQAYLLAQRGELEFVKVAGRTLCTVASLAALVDKAPRYVPDGTRKRGRAKALADAAAALT